MKTIEYYIGLKKDSTSGEWKWISDNSKVSATRGTFPWARGEPSNDGNCAIMYKDYLQAYGLFNDFPCNTQKIRRGYICEGLTKSTDQEGMSYNNYTFYCNFTGHFFSFQIPPYKLFLKVKWCSTN